MKIATVFALSLLALTACEGKQQTTAAATSNVNGVITNTKVLMTDYAMRAALGTNPNTAAYVTIKNGGDKSEKLLSATCACATKTTLHEMTMKDGVMSMGENTGGFEIKPGETLVLAPGGNHIMLEGLTDRPAEGQTVNVTLTFDGAGPVTLAMPVSNAPLAKSGTSEEHAH
ncbi:hypothetical protein ABI_12720 [Asticcacaulis biprosthecium C19]|uniref:Copper chaperone PCu(A)C n=1 Tax=Asticcacaulis biprosthecium C19 TaxID=715226 RepID=F4QHU7_9CAUL|nr:copper chaperone PCu(A)C [Asticcacaulis biprosthecium]EGF92834.1 hypothetical protein ABI_12720 [Asticcacaulis biprosthecium C19]